MVFDFSKRVFETISCRISSLARKKPCQVTGREEVFPLPLPPSSSYQLWGIEFPTWATDGRTRRSHFLPFFPFSNQLFRALFGLPSPPSPPLIFFPFLSPSFCFCTCVWSAGHTQDGVGQAPRLLILTYKRRKEAERERNLSSRDSSDVLNLFFWLVFDGKWHKVLKSL